MSQRKGSVKYLHNAKSKKNDEFYTILSDIEKELKHYKNHFKNKIVYCNCDDPYDSTSECKKMRKKTRSTGEN